MKSDKKQTGRLTDDISAVLLANGIEPDNLDLAQDEALKLMKMGAVPGGEQSQSIGVVFLGLIQSQRRLEAKLDVILATLNSEA